VTGIRIDLSPPETLQRFRDFVKTALDASDGIISKLYATLENKARDMGVHPADFEIITAELQIAEGSAQPKDTPPSTCEDTIAGRDTDNDSKKIPIPENAVEQLNLAEKYYAGRGIERDYAEALRLYRMAAESGLARAQFMIGMCYSWGNGVDKDSSEAVKWWRLAAMQGDPYAQRNLGSAYLYGSGVDKDVKEAVRWYRMVAEQGDHMAQFTMGDAYLFGRGVVKNRKEAIKWYRKAQGDFIYRGRVEERLREHTTLLQDAKFIVSIAVFFFLGIFFLTDLALPYLLLSTAGVAVFGITVFIIYKPEKPDL